MSPSLPPRNFLGQVVDVAKGVARVRPAFEPDTPPRRIAEFPAGGTPKPGSYLLVQELDSGDWQVPEVLAAAGSARADLYGIAVEFGLDPTFPPAVRAEVEQLLREPGIDDPGLKDYTALPFVTIDGASTRDLDQALWVEPDGDGYFARYALADASYYVRPGSALFAEALRRGASYYLPGLVVPMLPRALSEGLISLNPDVDRRALVIEMRIDGSGHCAETHLRRARIHSHAKLSFDHVEAYLARPDDPAAHPVRDPGIGRCLEALRGLGQLRMRLAAERDIIRYRRTEVEVRLADRGMRFVVLGDLRGEVELFNEQLSLLSNIEGARFLHRGDDPSDHIQPIFRVHPRPGPDRYAELEQLLRTLAREHQLPADTWSWQRGGKRSLADFLSALPATGRHRRVARAIHRQAVMVNLRSTFSEEPGEHFGVGAELYARFSAPMREVVGVFVHKEAWEKVSGQPLARTETPTSVPVAEDDELRAQVVAAANQAKQTQKRITQQANLLVLDQLFGGELGRPRDERPTRRGTVMGLTRSKAHVALDEPPVDVKVYSRHLERLWDARIELDDDAVCWRRQGEHGGRGKLVCRVGDAVDIQLHERSGKRDRWVLSLQRQRGG